ncbi:MAG: hypothetical protein Kow0059_12460 [Candidatus Sumerlaeia bacterium]
MKKKWLKIAGIAAGVLLAVVVIAAVVVYVQRNAIAKRAIEEVGTFVLRAPVRVAAVRIQPWQGEVELTDLQIGNPEGYKTREAFSVERVHVKADLSSLRSDVLHIFLIEVEAPRVTVEQGFSGNNLLDLAENAQRFQGPGTPEEDTTQRAQRKMVIDKIQVTGAKVGLSAPVLQGRQLNIPLPAVEMTDFGKSSGPITLAQAVERFIRELYESILTAARGIVPENLLGTLGRGLDALKTGAGEAAGAVSTATDETEKAIKEGVEQAEKAVKEGTETITEGVKGLLGVKKGDR